MFELRANNSCSVNEAHISRILEDILQIWRVTQNCPYSGRFLLPKAHAYRDVFIILSVTVMCWCWLQSTTCEHAASALKSRDASKRIFVLHKELYSNVPYHSIKRRLPKATIFNNLDSVYFIIMERKHILTSRRLCFPNLSIYSIILICKRFCPWNMQSNLFYTYILYFCLVFKKIPKIALVFLSIHGNVLQELNICDE